MTIFAPKCEGESYDEVVDLKVKAVMEMFKSAGDWFYCLAWMPYDSTFRIEALLDCLLFLTGWEYGKFQLDDSYKIELLQLGFGFANRLGRM